MRTSALKITRLGLPVGSFWPLTIPHYYQELFVNLQKIHTIKNISVLWTFVTVAIVATLAEQTESSFDLNLVQNGFPHTLYESQL